MAGSLEPKGVRSFRRIARAARTRLEPGEAVRWAVYARTARGEVQAPFGPAVTGGILYSTGRVQERVSFVRGSRRYAVSVNSMGPPTDHGAVEALAKLADDFAM